MPPRLSRNMKVDVQKCDVQTRLPHNMKVDVKKRQWGGVGWGGVGRGKNVHVLVHTQAQQPHHLSCCPADTGTPLSWSVTGGLGWGGVKTFMFCAHTGTATLSQYHITNMHTHPTRTHTHILRTFTLRVSNSLPNVKKKQDQHAAPLRNCDDDDDDDDGGNDEEE